MLFRSYGASDVTYSAAALKELKRIQELGMGNFPVCMAKTQYSLSDDASKLGRPTDFTINVREVYASAGAGFVVAVTGSIMTCLVFLRFQLLIISMLQMTE